MKWGLYSLGRTVRLLLAGGLVAGVGWGQDAALVGEVQTPALEEGGSELDALRALISSESRLRGRVSELKAAIDGAGGEVGAERLKRELVEMEGRLLVLEDDFLAVATGVTSEEFSGSNGGETGLSFQDELGRLVTPLLTELRQLSKRPRAIQELSNELQLMQNRVQLSKLALINIRRQLESLGDDKNESGGPLKDRLLQLETDWMARQGESESRVLALQRQIRELQGDSDGVWELVTRGLRDFILIRGRNVVMAVLAFLVVFFGLRLVHIYGQRLWVRRSGQKIGIWQRIMGLLNQGLSAFIGGLAALAVLYASGDWLLGALAVFVVLGLLLAAKSGFTRYFEQVRMLLNLGGVREGEILMIQGVPWRVGTINLHTVLTQPNIPGEGLRLPMDVLMTMTSRPMVMNECWFPAGVGDYVLLENDLLVQVESITPDFVAVSYRAGTRRMIGCADFISMQPQNLMGGFVITSTFGLDYSVQKQLQDVCSTLQSALEVGLNELVGPSLVREVKVEFQSAGDSSLDFLLLGKFTGGAAAKYPEIKRLIQKVAVETSTAKGWVIPFPQTVVHMA